MEYLANISELQVTFFEKGVNKICFLLGSYANGN